MTHHALHLAGVIFLVTAMTATGQLSEDATIRKHIDGLRGIQVPKEKAQFKELNARMDAAWKFIGDHQKTALPIVEAELKTALNEKVPDQFFLLDMGYLLLTHRGEKAATLAVAANEKVRHDLEEPCLQVRARLETVPGAEGPQVRFLHQVLGIGGVARHTESRAVERVGEHQGLVLKTVDGDGQRLRRRGHAGFLLE